MTAWLLLLLTVACAWLTYDAFRWGTSIEHAPFSTISSMWKGGLPNLSVVEQNELKQRYASKVTGVGQIGWIFFVGTVVLAILTAREFFS